MTDAPEDLAIQRLTKRVAQLEARERDREDRARKVRQIAVVAGLVLVGIAFFMPWYRLGEDGNGITLVDGTSWGLAEYAPYLVIIPLVATIVLGAVRLAWGRDGFQVLVAAAAAVLALGNVILLLSLEGLRMGPAAGLWVCLLGSVLVGTSQGLARPGDWDHRQWE